MNIELNFTKEQTDMLLKKHGYVIEDALMWYPIYEGSDESNTNFGKCHVSLAYLSSVNRGWREVEKPLMNDYKEFLYDNVVKKLVNDLIFQRLF